MEWPGQRDVAAAVGRVASGLPEPLVPLARCAYNYRWSWSAEGAAVFEAIDPHRWRLCGRNPLRLLMEAGRDDLDRAASDAALVARVDALARELDQDLARPFTDHGLSPDAPVAFFCAEFGVHASLPIYSGGLGVLAGDILKAASDQGLPVVGVGLFYRRGYFQQRIDTSGWQHEYWIDSDLERLPAVCVTGDDGRPVAVVVSLWGRDVSLNVWRVDVGRVPLYLLDAEVPTNDPIARWITARLYDGNRDVRLAQYGALGVGGVRALAALGIEPAVVHLNEGHAALAALELAARRVAAGESFEAALAGVRPRVVFTTHTPVAAGNETYPGDAILAVFPDFPSRLGTDANGFLGLGRVHPDDDHEPSGLTPLAMRTSRHVNGVSRRHGEVSRRMWQPLFPDREPPISHITNGVHLPTWLSEPFRALYDAHLRPDWREHMSDPETWEPIAGVPDAELWQARCEARRRLIDHVRERSERDRLARGEELSYVEAAARSLDPGVLTLGFARRLASYKRLHLLVQDPPRALALLQDPRAVQLLFSGKAHPRDDGAKRIVQSMFRLKHSPMVPARVAFLENYDMTIASCLVAGCDIWVNLPRPPLEASGTSGMKAALNGGLNLSVLDGWWAEAFDGENGWGIDGSELADHDAQDARDARAFYDLMEREVLPAFYERDASGVPARWVARMKASIATCAPRFNASRMIREYARRVYRPG